MESNPETCPRCGAAFAYETSPNLYLAVEHQRTFRVFECGTSETGQSSECQIACLQRDLTAAIAAKERVEGDLVNQVTLLTRQWQEKVAALEDHYGDMYAKVRGRAEAAEADAKAKGEMIAELARWVRGNVLIVNFLHELSSQRMQGTF